MNLNLDSSVCVYEGKHLSNLTKDSSHNLTKTLESFLVQNPRSTKETHSSLSEKPYKNVFGVSFIY